MVSPQAAAAGVAAASQHRSAETEPLTVGLWLIVIFKTITALLLWAAFVLLLVAGRRNPQNFFSVLVFSIFRGNPPTVAVRFLVRNSQFISHAMVIRIAVATVAYALVESAEAIGIYLRKPWAEWLVILVTVSFIPLEVYECITRPNPMKFGSLVANLVILGYLVKRFFEKRAEQRRAILGPS